MLLGSNAATTETWTALAPETSPGLVNFFFVAGEAGPSGCFESQAMLQRCCKDGGATPDPDLEAACFARGSTRWLCCSERGVRAGSGLRPSRLLLSLADAGRGRGLDVFPRGPAALCVLRESSRLLQVYLSAAPCWRRGGARGSASGHLGRCLGRSLSAWRARWSAGNASAVAAAEAAGCWPSVLGRHSGWADVVDALGFAARLPGTAAKSGFERAVQALNCHIFELNQLAVERVKRSAEVRFRPALALLANPATGMRFLEDKVRPHRGDVLLRHMATLEMARGAGARGADEGPAGGLTYLELGVGSGHLSAWLTARAGRLAGTMHFVDWFQGPGSLQQVASRLREAGLADCCGGGGGGGAACSGGGLPAVGWPSVTLCSALSGMRAMLHESTSAEAAGVVKTGSLDLIFIDASHDYEMVKHDLAAWWPKVAPGGILAGHDFSYGDGEVRQAVAEFFDRDVFLDSDAVWWVSK